MGLGDGPQLPAWALQTTSTEGAVLWALLNAYPRTLDRYQLEERTRVRDHAADRDPKIVDVMVCRLRMRFGANVIGSAQKSRGYSLSPAFAARLKA